MRTNGSHQHKELYRAEFEGLTDQDRRIIVAVSPEAAYYNKDRLDALLLALGRQGHLDKATFLVGDSLQRHTVYMKYYGVIFSFKKALKTALEQSGRENDREWGSVLARFIEIELKNPALSGGVAEAIRDDRDWEAVFEHGMWAQCRKESLEDGDKWKTKTVRKAQFLYKQGLISNGHALFDDPLKPDQRNLEMLDWDPLMAQEDTKKSCELVNTEYKKGADKSEFAKLIDVAVDAYVEQFIKHHDAKKYRFPESGTPEFSEFLLGLKSICREYLLEESAVFWTLMAKKQWTGFVYPFYHNETNPALFQCIASLCKMVAEKTQEESSSIMRPVTVGFHRNSEELLTQQTGTRATQQSKSITTTSSPIAVPQPQARRSRSDSSGSDGGGSPKNEETLNVLAQVFTQISGNYANQFSDEESRLKFYSLFVQGSATIYNVLGAPGNRSASNSGGTSPNTSDDETPPIEDDVAMTERQQQQRLSGYSGATLMSGHEQQRREAANQMHTNPTGTQTSTTVLTK